MELGVDQRHRGELDEEPDEREAGERAARACEAAHGAEVAMPDHGNMP